MEKIVAKIGAGIDHIHNSQFSARERSRKSLLKVLLASGTTNNKRIKAFCNIAGMTLPGFENQIAQLLTNPSLLGEDDFEPYCVGYGDEQTVFRVSADMVTKVDRLSLGSSPVKLARRRDSLQASHGRLNLLFSFNPSIVVNETFEIGPSHIPFFDAVRINQKYLDNPRDFFQDVGIAEGKQMVQDDPVLGGQIDFFQAQFIRYLESLELCPDILGPKNLSIVRTADGPRLQLLDAHMMHDVTDWTDIQYESKMRRLKKRLDHLKGMLG